MKTYRRVLAMILSIVMFVLPITVNAAEVKGNNNSDKEILRTIENELTKTLPLSVTDSIKYDSFVYDKAFVCTAQHPDGSFEYACNINGTVYYKVFDGSNLIKSEISYENDNKALSQKERDMLKSFMKDYSEDGDLEKLDAKLELLNYTIMPYGDSIAVVADESIMAASADVSIYCGMDELINHPSFGSLNNAYSSTHSFYCAPLSVTKHVVVRDLRTNYSEGVINLVCSLQEHLLLKPLLLCG